MDAFRVTRDGSFAGGSATAYPGETCLTPAVGGRGPRCIYGRSTPGRAGLDPGSAPARVLLLATGGRAAHLGDYTRLVRSRQRDPHVRPSRPQQPAAIDAIDAIARGLECGEGRRPGSSAASDPFAPWRRSRRGTPLLLATFPAMEGRT